MTSRVMSRLRSTSLRRASTTTLRPSCSAEVSSLPKPRSDPWPTNTGCQIRLVRPEAAPNTIPLRHQPMDALMAKGRSFHGILETLVDVQAQRHAGFVQPLKVTVCERGRVSAVFVAIGGGRGRGSWPGERLRDGQLSGGTRVWARKVLPWGQSFGRMRYFWPVAWRP